MLLPEPPKLKGKALPPPALRGGTRDGGMSSLMSTSEGPLPLRLELLGARRGDPSFDGSFGVKECERMCTWVGEFRVGADGISSMAGAEMDIDTVGIEFFRGDGVGSE